jgi:hypothetical protein
MACLGRELRQPWDSRRFGNDLIITSYTGDQIKEGKNERHAKQIESQERMWQRTLALIRVVPERGLEPPLPCENQVLNLARLPVPPFGHCFDSTLFALLSATNASPCRNSSHRRLPARIYAKSGASGSKTTGEAVKPYPPCTSRHHIRHERSKPLITLD